MGGMGIFICHSDLCNIKKIQFNTINSYKLVYGVCFDVLVTLNLNVLPVAIIIYAVPLSFIESFIGSFICLKISPHK